MGNDCHSLLVPRLCQSLGGANRIRLQVNQGKDAKGPKIDSGYAPEVSSITNGEAKKPYEFGTKVCHHSKAKPNCGSQKLCEQPVLVTPWQSRLSRLRWTQYEPCFENLKQIAAQVQTKPINFNQRIV